MIRSTCPLHGDTLINTSLDNGNYITTYKIREIESKRVQVWDGSKWK